MAALAADRSQLKFTMDEVVGYLQSFGPCQQRGSCRKQEREYSDP